MDTVTSQLQQDTNEAEQIRSSIILGQNSQIDDNLLCSICQELVIEPLECQDCQNLFCSICIDAWLKSKGNCPFRCASNPPNLKQPHRFVRNALNSLKFKCINHDKGCQTQLNMENYKIHKKECEYLEVTCPNQGCEFFTQQSKMIEHQNVCAYQITQCQKCNMPSTRQDLQTHDCIKFMIIKIEELTMENKLVKDLYQNIIKKIADIETNQIDIKKNITKLKIDSYKCENNHQLVWANGNFGQCYGCKKNQEVLRYICLQCKVGYCQTCRVPYITSLQCPLGHKLQHLTQGIPLSLICDLCRRKPTQLGISDYRDQVCDFDVCQECMSKL